MLFFIIVTGPSYGTQQSSTALQFIKALLTTEHKLTKVFFYQEGVYSANKFIVTPSDEFDLVRAWQFINKQYGIELHVCVAGALRRGIIDATESKQFNCTGFNLEENFILSGLSELIIASLNCDRIVQF